MYVLQLRMLMASYMLVHCVPMHYVLTHRVLILITLPDCTVLAANQSLS